jgi:hypothetical protein
MQFQNIKQQESMSRTVFIVLYLLVFELLPASCSIAGDLPGNEFYRKAPRAFLEAWLQFHAMDLCQGVDATFEFNESGMKVRSLVEDERIFQKFQAILEPLKKSYQIELETSRLSVDKGKEKEEGDEEEGDNKEEKLHNDKDPPPSLWENYELRYNLGDPLAARQRDQIIIEEGNDVGLSDWVIKQRLYLFAVQTLDLNKKMERYASDLQALVRVAVEPAIASDLRSKANAVGFAHALELGKIIARLHANLSQALPKSKKTAKALPHATGDIKSLVRFSDQIAEAAHAASQQIIRFLHPEQFTVGLDDLRAPSLFDGLTNLARMNSDFQKEIGKSFNAKK